MPISFHCETCRRSICVPDGSEGKKTRCPECYSIVKIPFSGNTTLQKVPETPEFTSPEEDDDPLGIVGKNESRWDPPEPPQDPTNPYVVTAQSRPVEELAQEAEHSRDALAARHQTTMTNLASVLMTLGGIFLAFILIRLFFQITSMVDRPFVDPQAIAELVGTAVVAFVQLAVIMALNEARMMRKYWTGLIGMGLCIVPLFNPATCLVFPLGLAIWGLALIVRRDVRDAFESQQRYTPD